MLIRLALWLSDRSPRLKRLMWRRWYEYLATYRVPDWWFMNYGYAGKTPAEGLPSLEAADEPHRYSIQLYRHVAGREDLGGRRVLEVGCGRGGGASYLARYHGPREMVGLDFSRRAIRFCRRKHDVQGLWFRHGDAERLPFAEGSFERIVNVESSHCYGSMPAFLRQAARVLQTGGRLQHADFRPRDDVPRWRNQLETSPLRIVEEEDITAEVVEALRLDSDRKVALIERWVSRPLIGTLKEFAAVEGSTIHRAFGERDFVYLRFTLEKNKG